MAIDDGDFTRRMFARVLADTHHNERGAQPRRGMTRPLSARRRAGDALEWAVAQRDFRAACARTDRDQREQTGVEVSDAGVPLHRYRIDGCAGPLWMVGVAFQVQEFFAGEQYGGRTDLRGDAGCRARAGRVSLDDACAEHGVERVDFLKLDVEGAELEVLRGAERAIRRWRPKLALSVYHRDRDLADIPAWVADLGLGYELYLSHSWPGAAETILFARPG